MPDPNVPDPQPVQPGELVARFKLAESNMLTAAYVWHGEWAHKVHLLDDTGRTLWETVDIMKAAGRAMREASQ